MLSNTKGTIHPLYGFALNEAIARGDVNEMQELAVVSGYLQRTQRVDPASDEGKAWLDAHQKLLKAIADKVAINVMLQPSEILSTGAGGVSVIKSEPFANALRTLMTSNMAGLYIKLSLG